MASVDVGLTISAINNATSSIRSVGSDVKNLGENAQATSNRLKAIQVVIAGILIDKTLEWGKALVATAASTQQLDIRMASLSGGAANAQKIWGQLAAQFAATPYKMDTISDAWSKLRTVVGNNDQTTTIISSIVTDVAAMGGKDENITNLSAAFQRMFASGIASSREYKSILQQTGLTLGDLAKAGGETGEELQRSLSHGFEGAKKFVDDFVTASNARFGFFAANLKNSVGGAYNLIFNNISKGLSDLGSRTDVNARMTVFFQNLAGAIDKVMAAISQKDIDHFFDWLKSIEPLIVNVGKALLNLGIAVLDIGGAIATLLSHMSPDMIEFGMVGYFLLGKKGALLGAIVAGLGSQLHSLGTNVAAPGSAKLPGATYDKSGQMTSGGEGWQGFKNMMANAFGYVEIGAESLIKKFSGDKGVLAQIMGGNKDGKSLFGNAADITKMQKALDDMIKNFKGGSPDTSGGNSQLADAMKAANNITIQLNDTLKNTHDRVAELNYATSGDELGANIQKILLQGDGFTKTIDASIKAESQLQIHTKANADLVAQLKNEKNDVNKAVDAAIEKERTIYALMQQQFVMQQQMAQVASQIATSQLAVASNQGATFNAYLGTGAGQNQLAVIQQQQQYLQSVLSLRSQIKDIEVQEQAILADPAKLMALDATKTALQQQMSATQNAMQELSATGKLTQQLWQNVGQTMENDVASGITGVLTGTETLGQALRSIFTDLISMSVKFLLQLIEMQLFGKTALALSMATSAPIATAMAALWGPAAMAASIATMGGADATGAIAYETAMAASVVPFANGGVPGLGQLSNSILTGPTMFGIGGEAGTEAVMPLTRIGGKLGVRADGSGGGNTYQIHVHAVDTQSGLQFVSKHIADIDAGLEHQRRLNRSARHS